MFIDPCMRVGSLRLHHHGDGKPGFFATRWDRICGAEAGGRRGQSAHPHTWDTDGSRRPWCHPSFWDSHTLLGPCVFTPMAISPFRRSISLIWYTSYHTVSSHTRICILSLFVVCPLLFFPCLYLTYCTLWFLLSSCLFHPFTLTSYLFIYFSLPLFCPWACG